MKQIIFSILLLLSMGCSSGSSSGSDSPADQNIEPINLHNQLIFYVLFSGGENVTYFSNYNISISETTSYIYKVVPDLNYVKEITNNTSYDYASSSVVPKTENGKFYLLLSYGLEPNDSHTVSKFDVESDAKSWEHEYIFKTVSTGYGVNIIDNNYYFKTYRTYDSLNGDEGGDLWTSDVTAGADATLLVTYDDLVPQYGTLLSSGTALYDIDKTDDIIKVYRRDLVSGASTLLASYVMADDTQYQSIYDFEMDSVGVLYLLRYQKNTTMVEVLRLDVETTPLSQSWELLFSYDISNLNDTLVQFDVDNGYCMLASGPSGMVYIYNIESGAERLMDFGIKFSQLEFLYYE